jgi:hypothetical protein
MNQQVSSKPKLLLYPLRSTAIRFPSGKEVLPSTLKDAWNTQEFEQEYEQWRSLSQPFPWAVEIYPDFPWMEAICGCIVRASKHGYSVYPTDSTFLTRDSDTPEELFSQSPWVETYLTLIEKVFQLPGYEYPVALPSFTGPVHLLVSLVGKEELKKLLATQPESVARAMERITLLYISFYRRILHIVKPTSFGYIAGGCFLSSQKPLLVLKDPSWMEFQHLLPLETVVYHRFLQELNCTVFLSTPSHTLRWIEPAEKPIFFEGIILAKDETGLPWEDLVPLFRMIQASGKTIVIAGPADMEDWEFALRDLAPENLIVLFYTTSFQEVKFWSEHLLGKHRRSR